MRRVLTFCLLGAGAVGCGEGRLDAAGSGFATMGPDAADAAGVPDPADATAPGTPRDAAPAAPEADARAGADDGVDAQAEYAATPEPGPDAAPVLPDAAVVTGTPVYPFDREHSPLGPAAVENLRAIAARDPSAAPDVFAKVGDSITVSRSFLDCFDGQSVDLGPYGDLEATRAHFAAGDAAGTSPFSRVSEAATVGWSVQAALRGEPSPLVRELTALGPRYAVVMFGTNDIENGAPNTYFAQMRTLVDTLIGRGVVPILSTIPPRDDRAASDLQVPLYNGVVRGLAQSRQVPLVDLHRALSALPDHGLGPDNLHPSAAPGGACVLTEAGLRGGYNVRNRLTLQALDRARGALEAAAAPDPEGPLRPGDGSAESPFAIDLLPFVEVRDTRTATTRRLDTYVGCASQADESGPEHLYRLDLLADQTVHAVVLDGDGVDVDLHLVVDPAEANTCLARHDRALDADLGPGTWFFVVDTFVPAGAAPAAGEYVLVVWAE